MPATRPAAAEIAQIDLFSPEPFRGGFPHEAFTRLRHEAPVSWLDIPDDFEGQHDPGFWLLTRHADVQAANRDTELFSATDGPQLSLRPEMSGNMLVSMDGRAHLRQRKLISAGFTPRMVSRLEEKARGWAVSILDAALERGRCDFVQDVAYQLPMHMIADIMGIPVEDRARVFDLTLEFLQAGNPDAPASREAQLATQVQMFQYAQELGRKKRDQPEDDVWTILSTVEVEGADGKRTALSEVELDFFFLVLTIAGSETTRNAISAGLVALLESPEQLEALRREPAALPVAVEEILRWTSPVSYFCRRATRDTEVRGVPIAKGDRVTLWYPSANRDEEVFDESFRFDVARSPNPHVAFGGGGPHFCLGANLARFEIRVLFEELLARTREIELLAPPTYGPLGISNPVLLALKELPVRLA